MTLHSVVRWYTLYDGTGKPLEQGGKNGISLNRVVVYRFFFKKKKKKKKPKIVFHKKKNSCKKILSLQ